MYMKDTALAKAGQSPIAFADDATPEPTTVLETFSQLFTGRQMAYGVSRGSVATTETKALTTEEYRHHLGGGGSDEAWSLGLNPLCEDGTVRFAALDLDAKGLEEAEVRQTLQQSEEQAFPLVWSQSRSGGLHGWLFLAEPLDASIVRKALTSMGLALGWKPLEAGKSKDRGDRFFEVFPKHDRLPREKAGNWIRLPWPGGERAERRRGVWLLEGTPSFSDWLSTAMQRRVDGTYVHDLLQGPPQRPGGRPSEAAPAEAAQFDEAASLPFSLPEAGVTLTDARRWLEQLSDDRCNDYESWVGVGMALHHQWGSSAEGAATLAMWDQWSQQSPKYGMGICEEKWRSFTTGGGRPEITIRSIRAWAAEDHAGDAIASANRLYALVQTQAKGVLHTPENGDVEFIPIAHWRDLLANQTIEVKDSKPVKLARAWLEHPERRTFRSVVFDPTQPALTAIPSPTGGLQDFNLWPGLSLTASELGSCELFLEHLRITVCRNDEAVYQWVLMWLAAIVQQPERLPGTALALRGAQGAGKSLVGEVMGLILGIRLYTKVSSPDELTGRFNPHHEGRLLMQVEEGFFAGDKGTVGRLKNMVTSPTVRIERKFMDSYELPNYVRLLITSNESWVVPAGDRERRFMVIDVSKDRANDRVYFGDLRRQMFENGGSARFLQYLQTEVVVNWDVIARPIGTAALRDQQLASMDPENRWLLDLLVDGELPGDHHGDGTTPAEGVYASFSTFMRERGAGRRVSKEALGRYLIEYGVTKKRRRMDGGREYAYFFPALAECRRAFVGRLAVAPDWGDVGEWQATNPLEVTA
jgi:hypothetical protein